ncbi:Holliday junction branch migration protein RuvA [Allobranchiibius sp. GilTou73]|uniref:Holliday junction branch migration protein RuvA n=1 Tax=Allobranchiibius sp. GilTou73 TaxID=2904523 RepID=UPI001F1C95BB|nr:Holliday junction branch migration protein RuvA [Allobranchiibius sp. GilTou73]UIJ34080.1 Holliday junction branch migration protein RuvA [Allobranchiibius sp. GilTou73]
MIASLRGSVLATGLGTLVVEVGGVGLSVLATPSTAASVRVGETATLATTLVVREDSLTLFGFATTGERDLFELVQTVSGVGPRLALAMLAIHAPQVLRAAIAGGDLATLVKVPGIGKKGAERIVLELKDKVGPVSAGGSDDAETPASATVEGEHGQVVEALVGLGWSGKQAQDAVERVVDAHPTGTHVSDVSGLLRAALRELGR